MRQSETNKKIMRQSETNKKIMNQEKINGTAKGKKGGMDNAKNGRKEKKEERKGYEYGT